MSAAGTEKPWLNKAKRTKILFEAPAVFVSLSRKYQRKTSAVRHGRQLGPWAELRLESRSARTNLNWAGKTPNENQQWRSLNAK